MPSVNINISHRRPLVGQQWTQREGLRHLANFISAIIGEGRDSDAIRWGFSDSLAIQNVDNTPGPAVGLLVGATLTGVVGATVGSTAVTVTAAGGDTATQTLLAAAIRANATVNRYATATNRLASVTLVTVLAGQTIVIFGKTFTAIATGAVPIVDGQFSVGVDSTAAALNLVNAINRMPGLSMRCRAVSVLNAVFIGMWDERTPLAWERINQPSAATFVVGNAVPVAGPRTMVFANAVGQLGNFMDVVASGTGMTYSTNGVAGRLAGGSGGCAPAQTFDVLL